MSTFAEIKLRRPRAGLLSLATETGVTQKKILSRLAKTMKVVLGDFKEKHEKKMFSNKGGTTTHHGMDTLGIRSGNLRDSFTNRVDVGSEVIVGTRGAKNHKYAGVHEHGATITSGNYMWIPLPGVSMTPSEFRDKKVFYLDRKKGAGKVAMLVTGKNTGEPKFTLVNSVRIPKRNILYQAQKEIMDNARGKFKETVIEVLEGR